MKSHFKATPWNGKPISVPGLYSGIPMEAYHSQAICVGTSVSSGGLRKVLDDNGGSPAHFYAEWDGNPDRAEREDKRHFAVGRAVHHLMLGQANFAKEFIIQPLELPDPKTGEMRPWQGNRIACKEWKERAQQTGRTILTFEEVADIKAMAIRLGRNPFVREGLLGGDVERSMIWRDQKTGLWLKARPDSIPTASGDFSDLKTTTSSHPVDVQRAITDHAYHQQMALIRSGAREVLKIEPTTFSLIFQEKKPPYCSAVVILRKDDLDLGERQNRAALDLIVRCIKEKDWPGPNEYNIQQIGLQDYYRNRVEQGYSR